jgi:hypothetical protein
MGEEGIFPAAGKTLIYGMNKHLFIHPDKSEFNPIDLFFYFRYDDTP